MRAEALKLEVLQQPGRGEPEKIIFKVTSDEMLILVILKMDNANLKHHQIIINQN